MMDRSPERAMVTPLTTNVRHLVRISGAIAGADEATVRAIMSEAVEAGDSVVDPVAVDEIILQSYLFAGFPRALNAARKWRAVAGVPAPESDAESDAADLEVWRERGLRTCRVVYGDSYEGLRRNIDRLHPALDEWMIVDGYGKVLSRPGVDLRTRELCVVAACAVAGQQRQLHSHLHGALNAGAALEEVAAVLDSLEGLIYNEDRARYHQLLRKVATQ
jgi:4-carboxymuconolactone decarboxylase